MNVQSLSITVPSNGCVNKCKYCVSRTHTDSWMCDKISKYDDITISDYKKRLRFATNNNINTVILTGSGEPLQNPIFLKHFFNWNNELLKPFEWIEIQTSGVMLKNDNVLVKEMNNLQWLRKMGVTTISLSLSNVFDSNRNAEITGMNIKLKIDIDDLCRKIKNMGFNLRLSLNMTNDYNTITAAEIFNRSGILGADQITFRILYHSNNGTAEDKWIIENSCDINKIKEIEDFIRQNGVCLDVLPFGAMRYDVNNISTVIDNDCMATSPEENMKYLILREDAKLYTRWSSKASILF